MSYEDQRATVLEFKKRFPRYQGLDIRTQRKVLDGELVIVNKGSRKFVLMTKDEVAPGGKLDKINAATRKANALIRAKNKAARRGGHKFRFVALLLS